MQCNIGGTIPAASTCPIQAGDMATFRLRMGPDVGQGSCGNANGIGGPVMVYLSKVIDASTADVSELFFKIFESVWECNSSGMRNADDFWG
ncbi:hypothetical protein S40293_09842 [Stachybotrys chartarum IBT 40293]|nr:hypothetical protein S40293_09842 [Stachybotrys chartarum IBT 40293]